MVQSSSHHSPLQEPANDSLEEVDLNHSTTTPTTTSSDQVNLVTEKKGLQFEDIFPTLNEILNDHGIKDKLKSKSNSHQVA